MTNSPPALQVRTRFAPSPTGYLHVGGARTALYCWAFARHHGGQFILRIEDTDQERSTAEAVQAILDGMAWLGLNPDEGPFYQMQRMDRYREVIGQMLASGSAYHCYATPEELDAMRNDQRARGLKPRYDGRWRPENAKQAKRMPPAGAKPVVRFMNPEQGLVSWDDGVKGRIAISNEELDDLIIARADGTPTYNFCVVVDDMDMNISHVIRGDDHINNTPRQINILKALGAVIPVYAHLPMIHGPDGEKLSKRHGAVSVMQYHDDGYLPEALLNYLARLGWSHGNDEIFTLDQLKEWFTLEHCSKSAAQFDFEKLKWLNNHYLRQLSGEELARLIAKRVREEGFSLREGPALSEVCELLKERAQTLNELAEEIAMFYIAPQENPEALGEKMTPEVVSAMGALVASLSGIPWSVPEIATAIKAVLVSSGLKMPALAMPLRLILMGRLEAPSVDRVMATLGRDTVIQRIKASLAHYR